MHWGPWESASYVGSLLLTMGVKMPPIQIAIKNKVNLVTLLIFPSDVRPPCTDLVEDQSQLKGSSATFWKKTMGP